MFNSQNLFRKLMLVLGIATLLPVLAGFSVQAATPTFTGKPSNYALGAARNQSSYNSKYAVELISASNEDGCVFGPATDNLTSTHSSTIGIGHYTWAEIASVCRAGKAGDKFGDCIGTVKSVCLTGTSNLGNGDLCDGSTALYSEVTGGTGATYNTSSDKLSVLYNQFPTALKNVITPQTIGNQSYPLWLPSYADISRRPRWNNGYDYNGTAAETMLRNPVGDKVLTIASSGLTSQAKSKTQSVAISPYFMIGKTPTSVCGTDDYGVLVYTEEGSNGGILPFPVAVAKSGNVTLASNERTKTHDSAYTVTFNKGESTSEPPESLTSYMEYSPDGWSLTNNGEKVTSVTVNDDTVVVYPRFTGEMSKITLPSATKANTVTATITFDNNDGSGTTTTDHVTSSYTFNGWYTESSGGTKIGGAGETYTPSYVLSDGDPSVVPATSETLYPHFDATQESCVFPVLSDTATETFEGWYDSATDGAKYTSYNGTTDKRFYAHWKAKSGTYLTFDSDSDFSIKVKNKGWDGSLYYSKDLATWNTWDGSEISATADESIYMRGISNTKITGGESYKWTLSGTNISCTGIIEVLLDYKTVAAGEHPQMADGCYYEMFKYCTSLTTAPELPATTLINKCYYGMFSDCTNLTTAPTLPATILAESCYKGLFSSCTNLTTAPELPATTLAESCYENMFFNCTNLTTAPTLPATTLADSCYYDMFQRCTSLTTAPALPVATLADNCYGYMFYGCTNLTTAPSLPATTLAKRCYDSMFHDCTNLTTAPTLPATTLADSCYYSMFQNCTSLTTAPALPATTLANYCYYYMFKDCTNLTTAPALPATTLANYCYDSMFYNCTSLSTAPALPATTLADSCYLCMFYGCKKLKLSSTQSEDYPYPYRIPVSGTGIIASKALNGMFTSTGGTFTGTPTINTTYYTEHPPIDGFSFDSDSAFSIKVNNKGWNGSLYYSKDLVTWNTWDGSQISATANEAIYIRGTGNTKITGSDSYKWTLSGTNISCTGNIENLLDYETVAAGNHPRMNSSCYRGMFYDCTSLTTAPTLPATTLADRCYERMFEGCTNLTKAPALPATTLTGSCYNYMFYRCTSLTTAPTLPATALSSTCYYGMFAGCTSLTTAPALPATTLVISCYRNMFLGCTNLKISETQTTPYLYSYRIPVTGTGTTATDALTGMFGSTGGTFTSTPTINTTYYTDHQPVG